MRSIEYIVVLLARVALYVVHTISKEKSPVYDNIDRRQKKEIGFFNISFLIICRNLKQIQFGSECIPCFYHGFPRNIY